MIDVDRFDEFFMALHGYFPFPWQRRLVRLVATKDWPRSINLPTASGKTTILDVFVFVLACQAKKLVSDRSTPRRMAFVVDRRVIVDEAFERAKKLCEKLQSAQTGILKEVAEALREIASSDTPLQCFQLRGGLYRDDTWARTPTQPTIITSTVDQIGSKLLFRSYGSVGSRMYSIHAGLAAYDMMIVLDEAHCAKPFEQTAHAIARYRQWQTVSLPAPFRFVTMTATPQDNEPPFSLDEEDHKNAVLHDRLTASKLTSLVVTGIAINKDVAKSERYSQTNQRRTKDMVAELVAQATMLEAKGLKAIGIMVNRVKTAREVYEALQIHYGTDVLLLIGRMRPFDRDRVQNSALFQQLLADKSASRQLDRPVFVVATQTLEVGANLDFDGLVTECASLDALRQRFGRLNRIGRKTISAEGVIVIHNDQMKDSTEDPVYGAALAKTWQWLNKQANDGIYSNRLKNDKKQKAKLPVIDFGINALASALQTLFESEDKGASLLQNSEDAPTMLPAHIDAWSQTAPSPMPEPDVSIFLHGPQRGTPEVKLIWRADLNLNTTHEAQIQSVALCPPTSVEALAAPLHLVRQWLSGQYIDNDDLADLEGVLQLDRNDNRSNTQSKPVLLWRGQKDSQIVTDPREIRANDTVILPTSYGGAEVFGYVLTDALDIAEPARWQAKHESILRLHPDTLRYVTNKELKQKLQAWANADEDDSPKPDQVHKALQDLSQSVPSYMQAWAVAFKTAKRVKIEAHPISGWVVKGVIDRTSYEVETDLPFFTDDEDSQSLLELAEGIVTLKQHTEGVTRFATHFAQKCGLPEHMIQDFELAGKLHDLGKADPRFQRWLYGCAEQRYTPSKPLIAKSSPKSEGIRWRAQAESAYPKGARHELLSLSLIQNDEKLRLLAHDWDLVLHLIASHHGHCRPFAPVIEDTEPVEVCITAEGSELCSSSRTELQRLDSGIAERFWALTRKFGWWGLAYLEAIFRLADHQQSARDTVQAGKL